MDTIRSTAAILLMMPLSACTTTRPAVEDAETDSRSEAGYSSAMLYRLREIIELESSGTMREPSAGAPASASGLRQTVWEYNVASADLCALGLATKRSCLPALGPRWLTEAQDSSPSPAELERRAEWVEERVQGLFDAVCEEFQKTHPDPAEYIGYCSIE